MSLVGGEGECILDKLLLASSELKNGYLEDAAAGGCSNFAFVLG